MLRIRHHLLASLLVVIAFPPVVHAQQPFGQEVSSFAFGASYLLADPLRPRVYASVPSLGSVAVINTLNLTVGITIPVGKNPGAMSLSPDNKTLYIANQDPAANEVDVIDLTTLIAQPSLKLPAPSYSVAAGLDNRLYVCGTADSTGIYQVDTVTGAVASNITGQSEQLDFLLISPDRKILYTFEDIILAYDVSTATVAPLFNSIISGEYPEGDVIPALSRDGSHLVASVPVSGETVFDHLGIYAAATDLKNPLGVLPYGTKGDPSLITFSADGQFLYQEEYGGDGASGNSAVAAYDLSNFTLAAEADLPSILPDDSTSMASAIAVDNSDSYLFVGEGGATAGDAIAVVSTGRGTPPTASDLPTVTITALPAASSVLQPGEIGRFKVKRTGDVSKPMAVSYKVKGDAAGYYFPIDQIADGTFTGTIQFAAGQHKARIKFTAESNSGYFGAPGVVGLKLKLRGGELYQVGSPAVASFQIEKTGL